jgi:GT2 family glycosyltransferase
LVTIVLPSFNQGEFLDAAIRSVLTQDYSPIECFVVDGGSTDGSVEIIETHADRLGWWVSEPDRGQAAALNRGFAHGAGRYFGWLGSDDTLLPGAVGRMVGFLDARPDVGLVYGDVQWTDRDSQVTGIGRSRDWDPADLARGGSLPLFQPGSLWRQTLWPAVGPFDEDLDYLFDTAFFLRLACTGKATRIPGDPLATYRVHAASKSGASTPAKIAEYERFGAYPFEGEQFELLRRTARARQAAYQRRAAWMLNETQQRARGRRVFLRSLLTSPSISRGTLRRLAPLFVPAGIVRAARSRKASS